MCSPVSLVEGRVSRRLHLHLRLRLRLLLLRLTSFGSCIPRGWARRSGTTAEARWRPQTTPGPALRRRQTALMMVVMEAYGGWRCEM